MSEATATIRELRTDFRSVKRKIEQHGKVVITDHGRTEIVNAICRAAFLGHLDPAGLAEALADFEANFAQGRLHQADILWRAALNGAAALSRRHTPTLGTRAVDVMHVACAMELKLRRFLTFDVHQQTLAKAVGLRLVGL